MGHVIRALIARPAVLQPAAARVPDAHIVPLEQGFALLPVTDKMIDGLFGDGDRFPFPATVHLSRTVAGVAAELSRAGPVAYVETEYLGGAGTQAAMAWEGGQVVFGPEQSPMGRIEEMDEAQRRAGPINQALQRLGVEPGQGTDEFDAVGLREHRTMDEWKDEEDDAPPPPPGQAHPTSPAADAMGGAPPAAHAAAPPVDGAAADEPPARRRFGPLASLLALLAPSLGHVYAGRAGRGIVLGLGALVAAAVLLHLTMVVPGHAARLLCLGLVPGVMLAVAADAWRTAAAANPGFTRRWYNRWIVYLAVWLAGTFVVSPLYRGAVIRTVGQSYRIPAGGMQPAILAGDQVMAAPLPDGEIARGTVVVAEHEDGTLYVLRVVGFPGETLEMRAKALLVNGRPLREPYARRIDPLSDPTDSRMLWQGGHLARPRPDYRPTRDSWGPLVVPDGMYFLLGDNRDESLDSRYLGFFPRERLVLRPVWIYYSREPMGRIRWGRIGSAVR